MSNRFRTTYRELSEDEKALLADIKARAESLAELVESVPDGRMRSLALTKLDESIMWAVKGTTG